MPSPAKPAFAAALIATAVTVGGLLAALGIAPAAALVPVGLCLALGAAVAPRSGAPLVPQGARVS
jgi:hypothetical protein